MSRTDDNEVPSVERRDFSDVDAFRDRDDGCVRGAEREVGVLLDQVGYACVVSRREVYGAGFAIGHAPQEHRLDVGRLRPSR